MTDKESNEVEVMLSESECAKAEIKLRCKELWTRLKELQLKIQESQQQTSDNAANLSPGELLLLKSRQLQGQIKTLKDSKAPVLPDNQYLLTEILKTELSAEFGQLNETLELVRSQRAELIEKTPRVKDLKAELLKFKSSLEEKIKTASLKENCSSRQVLVEMQERKAKLKLLYDTRLHQLKDFLEEHYPVPSSDQLKEWKKKHGGNLIMSDMKSLHAIIKLLMKRCTDNPDDPYIILDDTFWPPYVEVLLRCRMVSRHPEISQKIALTPYHL